MTLTEEQIELIRESYKLLKPEVEEASEIFYHRLFEIAPEVRPLFSSDMAGQGMRFMNTLGVILRDIDDEAALESYLQQLAEGHAAYGVKHEHFRLMGQALIATMRETLGDRFPEGAAAAWEAAYDHLADEMIRLGA